MAVGLFILWVPPSVGHGADFNATIDYEPVRIEPLPQDQKRHQEKDRQDRIHRDEMETKAQDARREAAYAESRKARIAKSKKRAKAEGHKPYNSWQLNHW